MEKYDWKNLTSSVLVGPETIKLGDFDTNDFYLKKIEDHRCSLMSFLGDIYGELTGMCSLDGASPS